MTLFQTGHEKESARVTHKKNHNNLKQRADENLLGDKGKGGREGVSERASERTSRLQSGSSHKVVRQTREPQWIFSLYLRVVYTVAKALPHFHGWNEGASSLSHCSVAAISGGAAAPTTPSSPPRRFSFEVHLQSSWRSPETPRARRYIFELFPNDSRHNIIISSFFLSQKKNPKTSVMQPQQHPAAFVAD